MTSDRDGRMVDDDASDAELERDIARFESELGRLGSSFAEFIGLLNISAGLPREAQLGMSIDFDQAVGVARALPAGAGGAAFLAAFHEAVMGPIRKPPRPPSAGA